MQFKKNAIPEISQGLSFDGIDSVVVPDQSMSLKEILTRFTRGESIPVGFETSEGADQDEDLEKLKFADLVDKQEFNEKLNKVKKAYEQQEARKKKAELEAEEKKRAELIEKEVEKRLTDKLKGEKPDPAK